MKKKCIIGLCSLLCFAFMGCGEEEVIIIPDTVEEIVVTVDSSIKSPIDMTKEELLALNAEEIQKMVETYLPKYRETYGIDKDREMTEGDWLELRDYIYYQIYGEIAPSEPVVEEKDPLENIDTSDPNWIYYAPTVEFLEAMTIQEFAEYMNGMATYQGVEDEIDFTTYSDEELTTLKENTIKNLAIDYQEETVETENS